MPRRLRKPTQPATQLSMLGGGALPPAKKINRQPGDNHKLCRELMRYAVVLGYSLSAVSTDQVCGEKEEGTPYRAHIVVKHNGRKVLLCVRWQDSPGTFDGKIMESARDLESALRTSDADAGYVVMCGNGASTKKRDLAKRKWATGTVRVLEQGQFEGLCFGQVL